MKNFLDLKPGGIVYQNGRKYIIQGSNDFDNILVKCPESGENKKLKIITLDNFDVEKNQSEEKKRSIEQISDKEWEIAERRYAIIEPLLNKRRTKKEVIGYFCPSLLKLKLA